MERNFVHAASAAVFPSLRGTRPAHCLGFGRLRFPAMRAAAAANGERGAAHRRPTASGTTQELLDHSRLFIKLLYRTARQYFRCRETRDHLLRLISPAPVNRSRYLHLSAKAFRASLEIASIYFVAFRKCSFLFARGKRDERLGRTNRHRATIREIRGCSRPFRRVLHPRNIRGSHDAWE